MFKDYYLILGIPKSATLTEIKVAFKNQALKWHPDMNEGIDTTLKMQEINEAYLILKDEEARFRYDIEYDKFKSSQNIAKSENVNYEETKRENNSESKTYNYDFEDKTLEKWIRNARRQAVNLAKQTLKEIVDLSIDATKQAGSKMLQMSFYYGILAIIVMLLFRACN